MKTLGIDLSTDPGKTYLCSIDWDAPGPKVAELKSLREAMQESGCSDLAALTQEIQGHEVTGIDVPFGWPNDFVAALSDWGRGKPWPGDGSRERLRLRCTDRFVRDELRDKDGKQRPWTPLSVSSDRLGATAMYCAHLLNALEYDRESEAILANGRKRRVFEVYPGASLEAWANSDSSLELKRTGYKRGTGARDARVALLKALMSAVPLNASQEFQEKMKGNDDALDALICSVTARHAFKKQTHKPSSPEQLKAAATEGWIHFPDTTLSEAK